MIPRLITNIRNMIRFVLTSYMRGVYHEYPVYDDVTGERIGTEWNTICVGRVHLSRDEPKTPGEKTQGSQVETLQSSQ
jgi:hypothetical protein